MGLYKQFQTDQNLEKDGVVIDYHEFRVRMARAGGSNSEYNRVLAAKCKPYRRAIQTETMDSKLAQKIEMEVYAETVILDWETRVDGEYQRGIEGPDGDLLPVTVENLVITFEKLPDLYAEIKEQANTVALFRKESLEEDVGNSEKS